MKHFYLLLISLSVFSQTKTLDLKIDSITSNDSLPNERRFTINYHIENLTDKEISFFLKENNLMPAHSGSMQPSVFYKLYQENEILQVNGILNNYSKKDNDKPILILSTKEEKQKNEAIKKYIKETLNVNSDSINAEIKKGNFEKDFFVNKFSKELTSTIYKLKPKELKKYTHNFYWNKSRYFKHDEMEYILDENLKFYLELYLILMKEEYKTKLSANAYKQILEDKNLIQGVFISNKMEIDFK